MQAVILAAGRGTRMGPLTETTPKPMLPVADRPLVAHVADAAVEAGADELVFTVGYGAERVRDHFGSEYGGVPIQYADQPAQLGTADALAAAADHIDGYFAVLNGDSLYRAADLERLFSQVPQVGAYRVDNPGDYGVLVTEDDVVSEVREKPADPPSDRINAGAYAFPADAVSLLDVPESERGERELTDVLDRLVERGNLRAVDFESWMDVGRPWELLEANEQRLPGPSNPVAAPDGGQTATVESTAEIGGERSTVAAGAAVDPDATIRGDVVIEAGAEVGPGVVIEGPTLVRSGASVGPNAYVRGATLLGENSHVGHSVEIKNSVVMADTNVAHLSYVGDSVLGRDVNLGAGTNVANLRHDGEPVELTVKGERLSTGRRKFGTVLGPGVRTGINTSINAGVTLGASVGTEPGEVVLRDR
jgi:bifunctional UDP-N-acetylglucosamine pyrophosphorylase/glucosamine-1-phosphate N-acetyltransferase